jgi:hypothetical protein
MNALMILALLGGAPDNVFLPVCGGSQPQFVQRGNTILVPRSNVPQIQQSRNIPQINSLDELSQPRAQVTPPKTELPEPKIFLPLEPTDLTNFYAGVEVKKLDGSKTRIGLYRQQKSNGDWSKWYVLTPKSNGRYQVSHTMPRSHPKAVDPDTKLVRWADAKFIDSGDYKQVKYRMKPEPKPQPQVRQSTRVLRMVPVQRQFFGSSSACAT